MRAILVTLHYCNGESRKLLINSLNQLEGLQADKRLIKSIKAIKVKI